MWSKTQVFDKIKFSTLDIAAGEEISHDRIISELKLLNKRQFFESTDKSKKPVGSRPGIFMA